MHRSRLTALCKPGRLRSFYRRTPTRLTMRSATGCWSTLLATSSIAGWIEELCCSAGGKANGGQRSSSLPTYRYAVHRVASCNADFNLARLERYLALANDAGTDPVVVLTKIDAVADAAEFKQQAAALQRELPVVALNARSADAGTALSQWCGAGATVALVGSSGVGKIKRWSHTARWEELDASPTNRECP